MTGLGFWLSVVQHKVQERRDGSGIVDCYLYNYLQAWGNHYNLLGVNNGKLLVLQRGMDTVIMI